MRRLILLLLLGVPCHGQTLTLSLDKPGVVRAGNTVTILGTLSGAAGRNIAAIQEAVASTASGTFTLTDAPALTAAGKNSTCNLSAALGGYICVQAGMGVTPLIDGVLFTYQLQIPSSATPGNATVSLSNVLGADAVGNAVAMNTAPLTFTLASPISPCDLNGDGVTDAQDVALSRSQVVGLAQCTGDLTGDGRCRVDDVIRIVVAASGGNCRVGP